MYNRWPSAQPWSSMQRFYGTDCLMNKNDIEPLGYDGNISEEEIIALAVKYKTPVIVKGGYNAKWYLKGKDLPYDTLMQMIKESKGKERYERCYTILIKFDYE
jgi:hypothetical protein